MHFRTMMEDCLFCQIVNGEVPSQKIAESDSFYAFLDINPISRGHCLVVPKEHSENFLDLPSEHGKEFIEFAKTVATAVKETVDAEGFNLGLNNGPAAGQAVFHAHFHVIPRWTDDGLSNWPGRNADGKELEALREKIAGNL